MQQAYYYLLLSGVATTLLWLPYAIAKLFSLAFPSTINNQQGDCATGCPDDFEPSLPNWACRFQSAYISAIKTIPAFAAVLIGTEFLNSNNVINAGDEITYWAGIFFWTNTTHAVLHIMGSEYIKIPLKFVAWFSIFAIAAQVFV